MPDNSVSPMDVLSADGSCHRLPTVGSGNPGAFLPEILNRSVLPVEGSSNFK